MPFPNEHACRVRDPGDFQGDSFRRVPQDSDGKPLVLIVGRLIGEDTTTLQAFRYPKGNWLEDDARKHCTSHDGKLFEPATGEESLKARTSPLKTHITRSETKVLDKVAGLVEAVVSSESVDRKGDIVRQAGWQLADFLKHPVLVADHAYMDLLRQIGEWESMEVKGKQLVGVARYYIGEGNPVADWAFNLTAHGKAAYSVGFFPDMDKATRIDDGDDFFGGRWEYNGQTLLEVSQVVVPANQDALQVLRSVEGLHPAIRAIADELYKPEHDERETVPLLHALGNQLREHCRREAFEMSLVRDTLAKAYQEALNGH